MSVSDSANAASVVAVSFQPVGRLYNYLVPGLSVKRGDRVVVEGEQGLRVATIEVDPHPPSRTLDPSTLKPVLRIATERDLAVEEDFLDREAYARRLCLERIRALGLKLKLVNVEYSFDSRKATFYYTAEERVNLRSLLRELSTMLNVWVEMKQIRAREETKATGALGPCGRELCCSSWLRDFEAITVKMAREQGLALNPSRLAGMCGRLKCCLRYEYGTYVELKRELPPVGKRASSVKGDGKVVRQNILKQTVLLQLDGDAGLVEVTRDELVAARAAN